MRFDHKIDQTIVVDRPSDELFGGWTDLEHIPRFTPGVTRVVRESETCTRWTLRTLGLPRTTVIEIGDRVPDQRLSFATQDGRLAGRVTFSGIDAGTTTVSVRAVYQPANLAETIVAVLGIPSGRTRRALVRFKNWAEDRPKGVDSARSRVAGGEVPSGRSAPGDRDHGSQSEEPQQRNAQ